MATSVANPSVVSNNAASAPFFDVHASDLFKLGGDIFSSIQDTKTAKLLIAAQQNAKASQTPNSVQAALTANTNVTEIAAIIGVFMILTAGGVWLFHKV